MLSFETPRFLYLLSAPTLKQKIHTERLGSNTLARELRTIQRKNLKIEELTAIIDTREQCPVDLAPLKTIRKGLKTGDYSVEGYEDKIAIERKSLQDFVGCCGNGRNRFEREIERLRQFRYRSIVVEGDWSTIEIKGYRGTMSPNSILGSALGWALSDISILFAGCPARAGKMIARMLWIAANRIHRLSQEME